MINTPDVVQRLSALLLRTLVILLGGFTGLIHASSVNFFVSPAGDDVSGNGVLYFLSSRFRASTSRDCSKPCASSGWTFLQHRDRLQDRTEVGTHLKSSPCASTTNQLSQLYRLYRPLLLRSQAKANDTLHVQHSTFGRSLALGIWASNVQCRKSRPTRPTILGWLRI